MFVFSNSIAKRLMMVVGGITLIAIICITVAAIYFNSTSAGARIEDSTLNLVKARANEMDIFLSSVSRIPVSLAASIQADPTKNEDALKERMHQILIMNPDIYGTCVAFEPNTFYPDQKYFAPYYWYNKGKPDYVQLGTDDYIYWEWNWYTLPRDQKKQIWTAPYYDAGAGETLMVTSSVPFYTKEGKLAGVTTIDVSTEKLNQIAQAISKSEEFGGKAHAILVNQDENIIAIDQPDFIGKDFNEIANAKLSTIAEGRLKTLAGKLLKEPQGSEKMTEPFTGQGTVLAVYATLPQTGWKLIILAPLDVIEQGARNAQIYSISVALLTFLLLLLVINFFTTRALAPLNTISATAQTIAEEDLPALVATSIAIAHGNLNSSTHIKTKAIVYHKNDEIGRLAKAFNQIIERLQETGQAFEKMTANLRHMVGQVAGEAADLGQVSNKLTETMQHSGSAANQIASNIQQISLGVSQQTDSINQTAAAIDELVRGVEEMSKGAQQQTNAIENTSALISEINQAIGQITNNTQLCSTSASQAIDAVHNGGQTVQETIHSMASIKDKVSLSSKKVQEMGLRSGEIGAIVETIEEIAAQTNLLALNAAIEAARAGEHGKGFAVVADEVRKLAEKSAHSTKEIGSLIHGIQKTVEEAMGAMQQSAAEVEKGVDRTKSSGQALDNIFQAVQKVTDQMRQISETAEMMHNSSNNLIHSIQGVSSVAEANTGTTQQMSNGFSYIQQAVEDIANVSQKSNASVEQVSGAALKLKSQIEAVTLSVQKLNGMAQTMQELVGQFDLGKNT
jgi:methyl-accepting chemotaxis protein